MQPLPLHILAVLGIVQKGDEFLIAKRSMLDDHAPGIWSFPGGKVEVIDGVGIIEESLYRELIEEVGVEISKEGFVLLDNDAFYRSSNHHVIALTFLCQWKSGEAKPLEDQDEVRWVTLDGFEKMDLPDYTRRRVHNLRVYLKDRML